MKKHHSPFFVLENIISPKQCEILASWGKNPKPANVIVTQRITDFITQTLVKITPDIENHYSTTISKYATVGMERITEGNFIQAHSENSKFSDNKWVRYNANDLTCVLFLTDYQTNVPFDSNFEVYGGKLEFPQWGFGFNPQRGTLIVFPSDPHFINVTTKIQHGKLLQIRAHLTTATPFFYNSKQYSGSFKDWF